MDYLATATGMLCKKENIEKLKKGGSNAIKGKEKGLDRETPKVSNVSAKQVLQVLEKQTTTTVTAAAVPKTSVVTPPSNSKLELAGEKELMLKDLLKAVEEDADFLNKENTKNLIVHHPDKRSHGLV